MEPKGFNEYDALQRVALRRPEDAFGDQSRIGRHWQELGYRSAPDFRKALREYDRFLDILSSCGAEMEFEPGGEGIGLDGLYVRDSALVVPGGVALCKMGKAARREEPMAAGRFFQSKGWRVVGGISETGTLEGGDFVWFDSRTCAVGRGYRTNDAGIEQLRAVLGKSVRVQVVPLPHYKGPGDVFHLMSIVSPLDDDLALVYSPLLPVPFREWLLSRSFSLVEVPDREFETMGCNVLALAPRKCLMVAGNPATRRRLELAGCEVIEYEGEEISRKGEGGPTCLTRPLIRGKKSS